MKFIRYNIPLTVFVAIAIPFGLYLWLIPWSSTSIGPFYGPKALTNPYLAAEMFLERHDVNIERHGDATNLDFALASSDVILMTNQTGNFTPDESRHLLDWVAAGGTLIYQPTTLYAEGGEYSDRILESQSIRLVVNPNRKSSHTPSPDVHHSDVECPGRESTVTISGTTDRDYRVDLATSYVLSPSGDISSSLSSIYVVRQWGSGRLVILTGLRQWRNNLLQCHDNAQFLLDLVVRESATTTWLGWLDGAETQPLYRHLWQWFPHSIIALAILLIWWLWNRIPRDQPVRMTTKRYENALEDYLLRKAIFRWQSANSLEQLNPLRKEILGHTRTRFTQSDYERVSNTTGHSVDEIRTSLNTNAWSGQREFIKLVATLSRLRGTN